VVVTIRLCGGICGQKHSTVHECCSHKHTRPYLAERKRKVEVSRELEIIGVIW